MDTTKKITLITICFSFVTFINAVENIFYDNFEESTGWIRNYFCTDNATAGVWDRANPEGTFYDVPIQLSNTVSGDNCLCTGPLAGTSAGSYDIDDGKTTLRSPDINLPEDGDITLNFSYYFSHYYNSTSDDYLRVKVVGSITKLVLEELGAANIDEAVWESFSISLNDFAGQTIYLLIEAADEAEGSLVEAAIDNVLIKNETVRYTGLEIWKDQPSATSIQIRNDDNNGSSMLELLTGVGGDGEGGIKVVHDGQQQGDYHLELFLNNTFPDNGLISIAKTGYVGIGTTNPSTKLDVRDGQASIRGITGSPGVLTVKPSGGGNWWNLANTYNGEKYCIATGDMTGADDIESWDNVTVKMTIQSNGNVGIGTISPEEKLDVAGTLRLSTHLNSNNNDIEILSHSGSNLYIQNEGNENQVIHIRPGSAASSNQHSEFNMYKWDSDGILVKGISISTEGNSFFNGGNVGVGTTTPTTELDVEGTITANEIVVDNIVTADKFKVGKWVIESAPDYVFNKDYSLRSLKEVENYIKFHNHLPEIPKANKIEAEGIDLVEMNMLLLKKVEELTLYAIEQEKKITKLEKIENEIEELKRMLKR